MPHDIFFDLDHIKWKASNPSLSLEGEPGNARGLGLQSCVLLDQELTLAELALPRPAAPPRPQHADSAPTKMEKTLSDFFFKQPKVNLAQY